MMTCLDRVCDWLFDVGRCASRPIKVMQRKVDLFFEFSKLGYQERTPSCNCDRIKQTKLWEDFEKYFIANLTADIAPFW